MSLPTAQDVISLSRLDNSIPERGPWDVESESFLESGGQSPVLVTMYRLLVTVQLVALGIIKAAVSYEGHVVLSTTFDLIICVSGVATLYWLGPCEALRPKVMLWMFHKDAREVLREWAHSRQSTLELETDPSLLNRLRLAVTPHRLLGSLSILTFGIVKAILGYKGYVVATTLDWVLGVFLTLLLYWIGLFEWSRPAVSPWFFHRDLLSGKERVQELDPKENSGYYDSDVFDEPPRFLVNITGYRILVTAAILGFGMAKAILLSLEWTPIPVTLEWVMGVIAALILYWIGFYEAPQTRVFPAFFQTDYSRYIRSNMIGPAILTLFGAGLFSIIAIFATSNILTELPTDNKTDVACRIILYIWLGVTAVSFLLLVANHFLGRQPPLGISLIFALIVWSAFYTFLLWLLLYIKQTWGYLDPNAPPPGQSKPGRPWDSWDRPPPMPPHDSVGGGPIRNKT